MASSGDDLRPTTNQSDDFPGLSKLLDSSSWSRPFEHPEQIGPYRILSILGEGGMGVVYTAEQRTPVHRQVAVKVIKLGMDTRDVVARFEAERQALAMMDHPNVARVIDAGATDTGRPYFVMDLVKGLPLTAYCDAKQLPTRQRLELFAQVCEAVQHAHMKGIIHRDLKPTNVLVAEVDGKPVPKVIDFGVAKAISHRLTERTLYTQMGQMIGTLEYMSPEQAERGAIDVDTRTDVYALGVMLYELLTGVLPFDGKELRSAAYDQMQRIIREVDPPRPSTRIAAMGVAAASRLAKARQESVEMLTNSLRHELEWIPLKAMRKEREARYSTASELADDVRNFLHGRALRAAPESRSYRAKKFLKRNRSPVIAAAVMLLLLVVGAIGTTVQAIRATRAERRARAQQAEAEQRFADVRSLAKRLLFELHPDIDKLSGSAGATRKLVDISMEYLNKLSANTSTDPSLLREMAVGFEKLGDIQGNPNTPNLGDAAAAMKSYRQSLDIATRALVIAPNDGPAKTALAGAQMKIADMQARAGDRQQALEGFRAAQRNMEEVAATQPNSFVARHNAVIVLPRIEDVLLDLGDVPAGVELSRKELAACQALADQFPNEANARVVLGSAHMHLAEALARGGDNRAAVAAMRRAIEIGQAEVERDPNDASLQFTQAGRQAELADLLTTENQLDEAMDAMNGVLEIARHLVASDPLNTRSRSILGQSLLRTGDLFREKKQYEEAAARMAEAIEVYKKSIEMSPADRIPRQMLSVTYGQLAALEDQRGDLDASLRARQASIDVLIPMVNAAPNDLILRGGLAFSYRGLGVALSNHGRVAESIPHLRKALELDLVITSKLPTDDRAGRNLLLSQESLAAALVALADNGSLPREEAAAARNEARELLIRSGDGYKKRRDAGTLSGSDQSRPDAIDHQLKELEARIATQPAS